MVAVLQRFLLVLALAAGLSAAGSAVTTMTGVSGPGLSAIAHADDGQDDDRDDADDGRGDGADDDRGGDDGRDDDGGAAADDDDTGRDDDAQQPSGGVDTGLGGTAG